MARKKKIIVDASPKGYTVNDRRGQPKASYLYPNPSFVNRQNYRPRWYTLSDTSKGVTNYDRLYQSQYGRAIFASMPDIGGALLAKASWVVGPNSFSPVFTGTDQEWGYQAEDWLVNRFYPMCNVRGPNFDFRTSLYLTSLALDVDGDNLLVFTYSRGGFPQINIIPSHRIGCRGEDIVATGRYAGNRMVQGVILNKNDRPIAYRILGDTAEEDYDVSAQAAQLLYESEWADQYRGISRLARGMTDLLDKQDIDEYLKQGVKAFVSTLMTIHTETGEPLDMGSIVGANEDPVTLNDEQVVPRPLEVFDGGIIRYFRAGSGEKLEALKDERPSPNTEAFIERIQRRILYSCGFPLELIDPSKVGGASVRLIQDLARRSIATRQATLERRARLIVQFAIANAMQLGELPQNNTDWYMWNFTKGASIVVDAGNEAQADRESLKLGTTTLSDVVSKQGKDWYEVRDQTEKETRDLLDRAEKLSSDYNISMDSALGLLSQRTPNQAPTAAPAPEPVGQTTP